MHVAQISTSYGLYGDSAIEIFVSGCKHGCEGCQNPQLWDFNHGLEMSVYEIVRFIDEKYGRNIPKFFDRFVMTGGDPLYSKEEVFELVKSLKATYHQQVWLYTGFTKEEIDVDDVMKEIFLLCDVVITDRFMKSFPPKKFAGSGNQRIWVDGVLSS